MGLLGFCFSVFYIWAECRRTKASFDDAIYIFVYAVLGGLAGAKIAYLLTIFPKFLSGLHLLKSDPKLFLQTYLYGGMVFYGGLFGGMLGAWLSARYFRVSLTDHLDIFVPPIALFEGFGRIGCLMAGCCYGKPTSSPLAVTFYKSPFAPKGVPLIPTQIYESLFDFLLFFVLVSISRRSKTKRYTLLVYLLAYSIFRFIIEFFRGDLERGVFIFSTSQWIALAVIPIALLRMICLMRQSRRA